MGVTSKVVETIPTDKHVLICGTTGTGKSVLVEQYLKNYKYVVKLDTKDETAERRKKGVSAWDGLIEGKHFTVVSRLEDLDNVETDKIIFNPSYYEQTEDMFNMFFDWVFLRENTIVWIDELMGFTSSQKCPKSLARCYTQGRSKNVGIWSCSQRPSGIPAIALSNSDYYFIFNMNNINDRKRVYDMTGLKEILELPKGHNFWYYKTGNDKVIKAKLQL